MANFKRKPILYRVKQLYYEYLCDYRKRFIAYSWFRSLKVFIGDIVYPHNVLKITTLSRHWHDRDNVLLHANFQILCDFINNELNGKIELYDIEKELEAFKDNFSQEEISKHREYFETRNKDSLELKRLYDWWNIQRPNRENTSPNCPEPLETIEKNEESTAVLDEYGDPLYYTSKLDHSAEFTQWCKDYHKFEENCIKEDTDNLISLINLRQHLWT